ncbi:non-motor actin binding protein [Lithospermum erythrorhizon]|uniref:Non-motor actin binding protein n=1 Tax=Lithospermum erythrorhizon TaxID=34254 RepID=A0AAV3RBN3_LITER
MALSRYEIRNEYSLADPELYKSANKDDPEALLEGIAMAGLVGVLRQLGDLAQFAAEVFHNLHEEMMATAARGHSLKSRIQQLEVEFPLIEKAFLSQTNYSAFFYTAGIDWHLNMCVDQNYITREDLPRFMMDSYKEARGPPRLFLLDKFDVVGDGACLKRYTDPSFYKVETASLGITKADVQRDKKVRKGKRRLSHGRNGETPEVIPTPHAKLHQLLLEECVENRVSDPARRVMLKRRLNGFPFDLKTGQSYMKKVLRDPPPDYRELHEVCYSSPLKLLDNNLMPEHVKEKFGSESPDVELTHKSPSISPDLNDGVLNDSITEMEFETSNESDHFKPEFEKDEVGLKGPSLQLTNENPSMTPHLRDAVPNISTDEGVFEAFGIESKYLPKAKAGLEVGNITSILYEDVVEKQIMVDKVRKSEGSIGYQSDDVASDVENYMDAVATMESEREIDSELRREGNLNVLSNRKRVSDLDAAMPSREAHFSDSQSMGSSTLSDDGTSSSKKCKSNSSYSSSPQFLAKMTHLVDEVSDEINSYSETGEIKSISRPLKWRGRTRNAGGSKVTAFPTYSSDDIEQTFSSTDVSPGVFVHRDADASVGENEVSQLKSGLLFAEEVPGAEPSNPTESESKMSLNACDSTSSATTLQIEYDSSFRGVAENHLLDNGEVKHLTEHSSSKPITSDDTCFTEGYGDQYMEEVVDEPIYLLQDVSLTSCTIDGAPLECEENLSSSPKYQPLTELANDNPRMSEHPSKPSLKELSENGLHEDLQNDESGAREVLDVLYSDYVHPSSCTDDTAEEVTSKSSFQKMPQSGDTENDFEGYPVVNQIDSQVTIMPPAEEQSMEPRLPELETNNRAIDTESIDDNLVKAVSPSKEVEVEERPISPFQRDPCCKNSLISGITDILQPLDPADSSIDNQIEEQFLAMSEEQFPDTSLLDTQNYSDGADHNVIILDRSTMALPAGEITVDMGDQALSGILKVGDTIDIQAPVVLGSVPQPNVETSDNGDEIPHELSSLAVIVERGVSAAGETDLGKESLKNCALNEMQASVTADDRLMHNAARVKTSSDQIINLHELARVVGEELEGVASRTDLGEELEGITENVKSSDVDVKGGRTESNQDGVDAEVPLSVMYCESVTEEKENTQKVPSLLIDYDHSESRILFKLSNSVSESSLHTDVIGSSTLEQSEFHMNGVRAEKNSLDDDTVDSLPVPIYHNVEEQKVTLPLQQLDEETEVVRIPGESKMHSYITDSSVLNESSSKFAHSNASSMSTDCVVEERKDKMSLHQLDKEKNEVFPIAGQSDVMLEPQLTQKMNSDILGEEGVSGVDSIYFSRNLLGQQLDSELLPWEKPTIDSVNQHNKPIGSVSLAFGLLPEAVNNDPVEMPPLPPLPPVQWRMWKNQQAYLSHEQAVLPYNNILFPSTSLSAADQRAETSKLILPSHADAAENSLLTYESTLDTSDQDCPSSLKLPLTVNTTHLQCLGEVQPVDQDLPFPLSNSNLLSLGGLQSLHNNSLLPEHEADLDVTEIHSPDKNLLLNANNKFPSLSESHSLYQNLPLPAKLNEMPQYDDHTGTSLNPSSSGTNGDAASACDVELLVDSETVVQFNKSQETSQNKILDQGSASSQSNGSNDASALPPKIENEQPHDMILCLEGEVGWPAQDEFKQSNVRPMKIPRQRNPLMDAVIALDKSKLRKVTEQPRTQIQKSDDRDSVLENLQLKKVTEQPRTQIQKADERDAVLENLQLRKVTEQPRTQIQKADGRDSLLEQIRSRSFNLKPTVVSRPGVQGPTTNLKLAAILEKAKTIRQAFAGSDEDDDDDSWSDS